LYSKDTFDLSIFDQEKNEAYLSGLFVLKQKHQLTRLPTIVRWLMWMRNRYKDGDRASLNENTQ